MYGNFNQIQIRPFGVVADVPDNDVAKLIYYLSCVDTVINYNELDKICDYSNYNMLTLEDIDELINFALLLNPKIFISDGIFILDSNLLSKGKENKFYNIKDERISKKLNNEIVIGDKIVYVVKVMACNINWLNRIYYNPLKNILKIKEKSNIYSRFCKDLSILDSIDIQSDITYLSTQEIIKNKSELNSKSLPEFFDELSKSTFIYPEQTKTNDEKKKSQRFCNNCHCEIF